MTMMTAQDQDDVESLQQEAEIEVGHVVPEKVKKVKAKTKPQQQESKMSVKKAKKTAKKTAKKAVSKKKAVARGGTTSAKVIAMLRRKGGATRGQILKLTGWKAISVQQVAAGQGVKLKIDTSKRPFHYMAA